MMYVYICNNDNCQEMYEFDEVNTCCKCGETTREVHRGDVGLPFEEDDEIDEEN